MKAIRFHTFGGPEVLVLEDVPQPEPGEGEALVRVIAAGVNPVDWKTREGAGAAKQIAALPAIPGWDISGVVEALGPETPASAGASGFAAGDAVYGMVRFPQPGSAYAEMVAAPTAHLAHKPASLSHEQAAAVPLAALTAWQALIEVGPGKSQLTAGLEAGQTVLVHAAAGGVGHLAVQLARWKGARVIGTASAQNADFVRGLGAEICIDYRSTRLEDAVRGVDVVLDALGGESRERSWGVLKPGGVLVSLRRDLPEGAGEPHGVRAFAILVRPESEQLAAITALIDAGHVRPHVEAVYPLAQAAEAQERSRAGHVRGKLVLSTAG